jgi:hypothetical protein
MKSKSIKVAQSRVECQEGIPIHTFILSIKSCAIDGAGLLPLVFFPMRQNWYFLPDYYTCL